MQHTEIVIITGSPGVGKTTLARRTCELIQKQLGCIAIHVEVDDVRWMVLGDKSDHSFHPLWLELVESIVDRALTFAKIVIVEGLFYESKIVEYLHIRYPSLKVFVLDASLELCLHRNRNRLPLVERLIDDDVKRLHNIIRPNSWKRLDANQKIETLVFQLSNQLN